MSSCAVEVEKCDTGEMSVVDVFVRYGVQDRNDHIVQQTGELCRAVAFSGALVFTEGQSREPANPQPWIRLRWLDPCERVVLVSRASWA